MGYFSRWIYRIEYINFENNKKRGTKIDEIIKLEPEILYVGQIDKMTHIDCALGELKLIYEEIGFESDTREIVSIEELGKRGKQNKKESKNDKDI